MHINTVDIVIPTYKPNQEFERLLDRLYRQSMKPRRVFIVNTRVDGYDLTELLKRYDFELTEIEPSEFDHGTTRDMMARKCEADAILFMTQDAIPQNAELIANLAACFEDDRVAAAYARQLPKPDCGPIERQTRAFNYPEKSRLKMAADTESLGIKTYFCSDVCAMYRRDIYRKMGGFVPAIFNEDMIMAGTMIQNGYGVYYAADATVLHSHNYTNAQYYRRNFDLAVSQVDHPEIFAGLKSEGEGIRMVLTVAKTLLKKGKILQIFKLFTGSAAKYLGYRAGRKYRTMSKEKILKKTSNPNYWLSDTGSHR